MSAEFKWYVAHTYSGYENKVKDSIEKTVDAALQQAEAMRQSILKQAFEGEL